MISKQNFWIAALVGWLLLIYVPSAAAQDCGCSSCEAGAAPGEIVHAGGDVFVPQVISGPGLYAPSRWDVSAATYIAPLGRAPLTPQDYSVPIVQPQQAANTSYPSHATGISSIASSNTGQVDASFKTLGLFGGAIFPTITDDGEVFGFGSQDDDFINGVIGGVSFGQRFTDRSRFDLEFSFRQTEAQTLSGPFNFLLGTPFPAFRGDIDIYSAIANFYFDFPNRTRFTPYIGAGIGYSYVESNVVFAGLDFETESNSVLSYQAMAGLSTRLGARVELYSEYRYFATEDIEFSATTLTGASVEGPFQAHNVIGGLRIEF